MMSQEPLDFGSDQPNDGESLKSAFAKIDRMMGELYALLHGCQAQLAVHAKKDAVTSFKSRAGAVAPMSGDYRAAQVSVAPAGGLAAADVQSALAELDGEAAALSVQIATLKNQVGTIGDLQKQITAVETRAGETTEKLKALDALSAKVTAVENKAGVASFKSRVGEVAPMSGDYSADQVSVTPAGGLTATDVQAALVELDRKKLAALDPVLTGYRETVESQNVTAASHAMSDISLGNVKRLALTVDTTLTLPSLTLAAGTGAALSVAIVQDGAGYRSVTFAAPGGQSIVWDGGGNQPAIAVGPYEETLFSFYKIAESPDWKGVRTHKGG